MWKFGDEKNNLQANFSFDYSSLARQTAPSAFALGNSQSNCTFLIRYQEMASGTFGILTPIQNFYNDKNVLITGATGFLGRLLLEKLLRACPIRTVYVLIRAKKGKQQPERLRELFECVVFDRLKLKRPDFQERVVPVSGDFADRDLALSPSDRELLIANVHVVFHCAATVNFNEKLHLAARINIRGARDLLALARQMRHLVFYTHVSTAYAHCPRRHLAETFHACAYQPQQMIDIVDALAEPLVERIAPMLVDRFPNTYTFTKSVSEQLIADAADLPVAVFRPAIIVSTFKEPVPGWINNYYGPQGVTVAAMVGLMRTMHCDGDVDANIVPVDMCANALLALPWDATAEGAGGAGGAPRIYHFETATSNPLDWRRFRALVYRYGIQLKTMRTVGVYFFHLRRNYYCHLLATVWLHYVPALLIDGALLAAGRKPRLIAGYRKLHHFSSMISYFCTQSWTFESRHVTAMYERMAAADRDLFACDLRQLDWSAFFKTYLLGCRVHLLKDPIETLPSAIRLHQRVKAITIGVLFVGVCVVGYVLALLIA